MARNLIISAIVFFSVVGGTPELVAQSFWGQGVKNTPTGIRPLDPNERTYFRIDTLEVSVPEALSGSLPSAAQWDGAKLVLHGGGLTFSGTSQTDWRLDEEFTPSRQRASIPELGVEGEVFGYLWFAPGLGNDAGLAPLITAAYGGDVGAIQSLLSTGEDVDATGPIFLVSPAVHAPTDLQFTLYEGATALMIAAVRGRDDIVRLLLQGEADADLKLEGTELTALRAARFAGHSEVVQLLDGLRPALFDAVASGDAESVSAALASGADVNATGEIGETALLKASVNGNVAIVEILLAAGADMEEVEATVGVSPLIGAAQSGHEEVVQVLLENGAEVDHPLSVGTTALLVASDQGYVEVVRVLLDHGAAVNHRTRSGVTALMNGSQEGHEEVVRVLLENGADANLTHSSGKTALIVASQQGHEGTVEALLDSGAVVNYQNPRDGVGALGLAAQNGHDSLVTILLARGAEIDHQPHNGVTALFIASNKGHIETVRVLLAAGANVNLRERGGSTALTHARTEEIKELLRAAGARNRSSEKSRQRARHCPNDRDGISAASAKSMLFFLQPMRYKRRRKGVGGLKWRGATPTTPLGPDLHVIP